MEIPVKTKERVDFVNITDLVGSKVSIDSGIVVVYTPHTTTGIFINEDESNLIEDVKSLLERIAPQGGWKHDSQEGNADAHLRGILLGSSVVVPVSNGKLDLGSWQSVFFYEGDGPRSRKVIIKEIKS